ncbi:MAG TPA: twin-arginine translocation signal domain-containing protein [Burkholderiales bacterium]|nr:twin-arginine translocation signal domain-containing protein [Burkholderiales bacterium]
MSQNKSKLSRRNFLLAVGAGGAAGAAAIAAKTVPPAPPATTGNTKRSSAGYQASAHVRNYYRTAKV